MAKTTIEWSEYSWTPLRARVKNNAGSIAREKQYTSLIQIASRMAGHVGPHCERVSAGCGDSTGGGCYSEANNHRCLPSNGTGLPFDRRSRDLVDIFLDEKILQLPLHWKRPRKIFVCSQTDLFGEWVPDEAIDRVFAVMALCPQHSFQILTKRPERMLKYFADQSQDRGAHARIYRRAFGLSAIWQVAQTVGWPLPNCWLGVSAEDQKTWDERTAILEQVPATVRFVSLEPQLEYVDVGPVLARGKIHWLVQGGESGPGARPFNVAWAQDARKKSEGHAAYFLKQLGADPYDSSLPLEALQHFKTKDRKGGDMSEWEAGLCVRQYPKVRK